ncbi:MAG TPA: DUF21 domain-containing protein, partial [Saprospiraceae bacterium]|nr:DUF21 domain-containing protein [Saprospiraceae bacterium]
MDADPYLSNGFLSILSLILYIPWADLGNLIALVLFLLASGLFSGSEIAMFSLSHEDLDDIKEQGTPASKALVFLKTHTKRLLALILICNTFVNIAIALIVERLLASWLPPEKYTHWSEAIIQWLSIQTYTVEEIGQMIYFLIAVVGATTLILFFGEVMPKIYGRLNTKSLALTMAVPLRVLDFIFTPMTYLMVSMTHRVEKRLLEKKVGIQSTSR